MLIEGHLNGEIVKRGGVICYPLPVHGVLYRPQFLPPPVNVRGEPDQTGEAVQKFKVRRTLQFVNKLQEVFDLYKVDSSIVIIRTKKPGKKKAAPGVTSTEGSGAE